MAEVLKSIFSLLIHKCKCSYENFLCFEVVVRSGKAFVQMFSAAAEVVCGSPRGAFWYLCLLFLVVEFR